MDNTSLLFYNANKYWLLYFMLIGPNVVYEVSVLSQFSLDLRKVHSEDVL